MACVEFDDLVRAWAESADFDGDLVHLERVRARGAIFGDLQPVLDPIVARQLAERGIERLYRHQARAVGRIRSGEHTVVVSGTASGKSLCYQIPLAETIVANPRSSALLLYPTKALAQDQLRSIGSLGIPGLTAATYDGDTDPDDRTWVRVMATCAHQSRHAPLRDPAQSRRWEHFFHRLSYVVVDEAHMFRGIFGTHVAHGAAETAAAGSPLRCRTDLRLHLGDDRQPGRSGKPH